MYGSHYCKAILAEAEKVQASRANGNTHRYSSTHQASAAWDALPKTGLKQAQPTNCVPGSNSHRAPAQVARGLLPQFGPQQGHGPLQIARFSFRELKLKVVLYLLHDPP